METLRKNTSFLSFKVDFSSAYLKLVEQQKETWQGVGERMVLKSRELDLKTNLIYHSA